LYHTRGQSAGNQIKNILKVGSSETIREDTINEWK